MTMRSTGKWLALLFLSAAGCSSISDGIIRTETDLRNQILAQKAWGEWSWCYDELNHPWDFAKGFKAGYRNILEGGSGCQPTLPPRAYWKPSYETTSGRGRINSWFDGYSHGALAAQQDGMGGMGVLPISPTARANLISKNAPVNPECFNGLQNTPTPEGGLLPQTDEMDVDPAVPAGEDMPPNPGTSPSATRPYEGN